MSLQDQIGKLRELQAEYAVPLALKERIRAVLKTIDRESDDMVDTIFALMDCETPSLFPKARGGTKFCDGASTQQIASHVGTLQRSGKRLDREGRDYWIKPLCDIEAIEPVYLQPKTGDFVYGHPVPKSPNSAYRLSASFREILTAPEAEWEATLRDWIGEDNVRSRLQMQSALAALARNAADTKHHDLIQICRSFYASRFLPGYKVIYVDDSDGERITDAQKAALAEAGVALTLGDAMPDVLLWNAADDSLWVIEAVTSDGEVDLHKMRQLSALAHRSGKRRIDFTTAYQTWKVAARRQSQFKNLAPGTYLWIVEDPSKHFHALELAVFLQAE